jgi:protease I
VQGWKHLDKGERIKVDVPLEQADAANYDALLLPGGVANPDQLRTLPKAVQFVRSFFETGKPVAAICHGPWTLIEAGVVRGRTLTSWPSLKTDLVNAGAMWVDQEVCSEHGLITSRKPADIPAFNQRMIAEFAGGERAERNAAARSSPGGSSRPH